MREHYDIGVVGCWWGANYGSVLNGYAVYNTLKSLGLSVLMIHKHNAVENDWEIVNTHNEKFIKNFYPEEDVSPIIPFERLPELNNICDMFLTGSDQIWNYGINRIFDFVFMLNFADDGKKKLSFGTSFGHADDGTPPDKVAEIAHLLQRYNAISVREKSGADICANKYGVKADVVCEPVFCLTKEEYCDLADKSKISVEEPYILTYILDPTPEKREAIQKVGNKKGLKVINVLDGDPRVYDRNFKLLNLPNTMGKIGAEDLMKLYQNASFVITDSFHGTCFSIIFEKPFLAIANYRRGVARFNDLLSKYNLLPRLATDTNNILGNEEALLPLDYTKIREQVNQERLKSIKWLKNAVETQKDKLPSIILRDNRIKPKAITSILDMKICTGCGACSNVCPKNAIEMAENKDGFLNPVIDNQKCIDCGLCSKNCIALNQEYKNIPEPKCYAMTADDETRLLSSSGGMFTVAAEYIIENGGYVCGAAFNSDFSVSHRVISSKEELHALRGSKYIQSNVGESYKKVKELLDNEKTVLFTGMPCQIAGLYSYLGKEYANLYTIDLFCHGIASHKVFEKYHRDIHDSKPLKALGFKEKRPWGWHAGVNAYFEDGTHYAQPLETDPYYKAYLSSISKNTACGVCKFNRLPRQGDLSIGDFWGIGKCDPKMNDGKGTSAVLINSEKGKQFFESLTSRFKAFHDEPLSVAISGNGIITHPYPLHKYRNLFFEYLEMLPFDSLTDACRASNLYKEIHFELVKNIPNEDMELFWLAKAAVQLCGGREIVTWIRSAKFETILMKYFGKTVAFGVSARSEIQDGEYIKEFSILNKKSDRYFLVVLDRNYDTACYNTLSEYGYGENKDYIFRICKPIVVEKLDLSKEVYFDSHGNTIEGKRGIIGKVVFSGGNNHIFIGENVRGTEKLNIYMSSNGIFSAGDNTVFAGDFRAELNGYGGRPFIKIGESCYFNDALIRIYNDSNNPSVTIGDATTFSFSLDIHANQGKKIIIGKECMFSNNISMWAGDGHTIFDVKTGKVKNLSVPGGANEKDFIVIGNHVWVGKDAFILSGAHIGDGSIVAARSVVTKTFSNNCSIGGSPARLLTTDVAWSGQRNVSEMSKCVKPEYAVTTNSARMPISGYNVLVIADSDSLYKKIVVQLLERGNKVTLASGKTRPDNFGIFTDRLEMDVGDYDSVKAALNGKYFDIIFNVSKPALQTVKNITENCRYGKYIGLSSDESYYGNLKLNTDEGVSDFSYARIQEQNQDTVPASVRDVQMTEKYIADQVRNALSVRIPSRDVSSETAAYCRCIIKGEPIPEDNISAAFPLVSENEIASFLPWIAAQECDGAINLSSENVITSRMIIERIEEKLQKKAVFAASEAQIAVSYSLELKKAKALGYSPTDINKWVWETVDKIIDDISSKEILK